MRRLAVFTVIALAAAPAARSEPPASLEIFLRQTVKLNAGEIASLEKGKVVAQLLPAKGDGEIAAFGIVRVKAGKDAFAALARDPLRFRHMDGVEQIGVFSVPPAPGDVAALKMPDDDLDALKKCRPGSCDVKLTGDALDRIATVAWSAKDAKARAAGILRDMMVELAAAYRTGGIDVLGTMVDKKQPKSRADEFHRVLENSPYLYKFVPDLHRYLDGYPKQSYTGATTTLYWMHDTFSPKPVISTWAGTVASAEGNVIAAQQMLTASHFFSAGLDVCVAVPGEDGRGTYIIDVYRVRIDPPTGMMAGPAMKRVEKGIAEGVEKSLEGIRKKLKG